MPELALNDREVELIRRVRMTPEERAAEIAVEHEATRQRMTPERRAAYDAACAARAALTPLEKKAAFVVRQQERIAAMLVKEPKLALLVEKEADNGDR